MRSGYFAKALSLCLGLLLLLSTGGAFAIWIYAGSPVSGNGYGASMDMNTFDYPPEVIIPGGEIEAPLGQNHLLLIEKILNEKDYGLNATKKPIMHTVLESDGVLYCSQTVQGGNLKHLLIDSSVESEKLYFTMAKISDTEYHVFTFLADDLDLAVGAEIPAYKTVMVKGENGKWTAPKSYKGYIKVNRPGVVNKGVDVTSFRNA